MRKYCLLRPPLVRNLQPLCTYKFSALLLIVKAMLICTDMSKAENVLRCVGCRKIS